jgi:plastocyanin
LKQSLVPKITNRTTIAFLLGLGLHALSLVLVFGAEPQPSAQEPALGTIDGSVTFQGKIPRSSIPDDAGVRRNLLQVDEASRGLANVVVWLTAEDSRLTGRSSKTPPIPTLVDQRDHEFVPRVVAVLAGQAVKFSNSDPANHNVRTLSPLPTNEFNVFTGIDGSYTHHFAADPQQRPIRLGCDIHPWMRGWIYVFQHPCFAVTDEHGRFRINSVPAGKYTLALRQPDIRYAREEIVTISNMKPTKVQIEIRPEDANKPKE